MEKVPAEQLFMDALHLKFKISFLDVPSLNFMTDGSHVNILFYFFKINYGHIIQIKLMLILIKIEKPP